MEDFGNSLFVLAQDHIGFVLIIFGIFLIIAAIRDWSWLIEPGGAPSLGFLDWMNSLFGRKAYRIGIIMLASIIILCGIVFVFIRYW